MKELLIYPALAGVGYTGYRAFKRGSIPAAAMLGSMLLVAVTLGFGVPWPDLPLWTRQFFQIIIGTMIGSRFSRELLRVLKKLVAPAVLVAVWMVMTGLLNGYVLARVSPLDSATALISATPGGLAEMTILAFSYHMDASKVAFFHSLRIILVYATIPMTMKWFQAHPPAFQREDASATLIHLSDAQTAPLPWYSLPVLRGILLGIVGGTLGYYLGLPAGGMLGALLLIASLRIAGFQMPAPPPQIVTFAQIGMGVVLGLTFNQPFMHYLKALWLPLLVISVMQLLSGFLLAYFIHRIFRWDLLTALCACSPAGLSQMSAIALELDADPVKVSLMHLVRLLAIVLVIPFFLSYQFL
ncbi:AbrB family transcriptional regulator [Anoxynatronum buryatiense]|uniref:Ammonia monooxygenase n=1 Tax=Anoxynatronum buryatiense TaxID=489973 RepID=A0AA45WYD4_9CLOT|nr:AbrB family transcriptional regulator [Anoxynatronum buryatiense]SMP68467.1 hypothetical protein SAMN06296020_11710 [Anoxynatronum buryatiense]